MIYRAARQTAELLETGGVPIGITETVLTEKRSIVLEEGDTLLIYTDGLTGAGMTRTQKIGTEGLRLLFRDICTDYPHADRTAMLVQRARQNAGGFFRDDICADGRKNRSAGLINRINKRAAAHATVCRPASIILTHYSVAID